MSKGLLYFLLSGLIGLASAEAQSNPYYDPSKPHHTPDGFRNTYIDAINKPAADLARWRWEATRAGLPLPSQTPTPTQAADVALIHGYTRSAVKPGATLPRAQVTWLGHATALVQAGGLNVLTDPMFSQRASPVQLVGPKRAQAPGMVIEDLPPIDVVLISHNHYDHLDRNSIAALHGASLAKGNNTVYLVPLGHRRWFADLGIDNVVELDWWQHHSVQGVDFYLTPVQHWSARGLSDRSKALWGGWAVFSSDLHWYFGGDAGYSQDFADTRQHFASRQNAQSGGGFDLALIPVGAYAPRWFMKDQHLDPDEAVQTHLDLGAKRSMGIHWGTFELTDEALDQPPKDLAASKTRRGITDHEFFLLKIGETRQLAPRSP
jgi:N-acyl-phosphatidylethanolamine-hydrolysing phospholipase D